VAGPALAARLSQTVGAAHYGERMTPREPIAPTAAGATRLLASVDFVIVDVETTGWLPQQAGITEIGAVRIGGGQPLAEFSALVNPGYPIPADITALTGITNAMVRQAPPIGAILPGFLAFSRGCVLTAHNAPFDIGFLAAACSHCRILWPSFPVLDTAALARSVLDETEVPDCKLSTLACFFGARTRPCHRALADARATADVLRGLLARLATTGVRTLAEIGSGQHGSPGAGQG
jgi:DNA polymerase III subunit epsilon